MKTTLAKPDLERKWYVVDATGQNLGRLSVKIANILRGRHKPIYTPHIDAGDYVVVINADKISVSGNKPQRTFHYRHSGYPGGLRRRSVAEMLERHPDRLVEKAIVGMLPKTKLGRQIQKKLRVYTGSEHPHTAQQPIPYDVKQVSQ